ncbi:hypothetical protein EVAR_19916_1 [Eumeta japonica]|uniref:Uncharacterized protein n=1 Tax=Eumeta variegata TaxID=151549 RepID=A0A4C1ZMI8_EUMVA|nr:hypothetical protein EVAR_19916_1 [Eumeta japonica]
MLGRATWYGGNAFNFPARAPPPTPPPPLPHHNAHPPPPPPPLTPHHFPCAAGSESGTPPPPPPLPPRRRRDSVPAPPAPSTPHIPGALGVSPGGGGGGVPPPLPPRPPPAPALLRPAHSTILQRRHHNRNNRPGRSSGYRRRSRRPLRVRVRRAMSWAPERAVALMLLVVFQRSGAGVAAEATAVSRSAAHLAHPHPTHSSESCPRPFHVLRMRVPAAPPPTAGAQTDPAGARCGRITRYDPLVAITVGILSDKEYIRPTLVARLDVVQIGPVRRAAAENLDGRYEGAFMRTALDVLLLFIRPGFGRRCFSLQYFAQAPDGIRVLSLLNVTVGTGSTNTVGTAGPPPHASSCSACASAARVQTSVIVFADADPPPPRARAPRADQCTYVVTRD